MIISAYRKCKIMYIHVSHLWAKEMQPSASQPLHGDSCPISPTLYQSLSHSLCCITLRLGFILAYGQPGWQFPVIAISCLGYGHNVFQIMLAKGENLFSHHVKHLFTCCPVSGQIWHSMWNVWLQLNLVCGIMPFSSTVFCNDYI